MAVVNTVKTLFPGLGNSTEYIALLGQTEAVSTANPNVLTGFINYVRSGKVRAKSTAAPASSVVSGILITGTDGTTTVILYQDNVTRAAATLIDFLYEFISELNINSITVTVTLAAGGTAQTWDFEVAGNP